MGYRDDAQTRTAHARARTHAHMLLCVRAAHGAVERREGFVTGLFVYLVSAVPHWGARCLWKSMELFEGARCLCA